MTEQEDETIYDEKGRKESSDNDEISPEEEGFMKGYDEADEKDEDKDDEESDDKEKDKEEE